MTATFNGAWHNDLNMRFGSHDNEANYFTLPPGRVARNERERRIERRRRLSPPLSGRCRVRPSRWVGESKWRKTVSRDGLPRHARQLGFVFRLAASRIDGFVAGGRISVAPFRLRGLLRMEKPSSAILEYPISNKEYGISKKDNDSHPCGFRNVLPSQTEKNRPVAAGLLPIVAFSVRTD
jgi:hypothetical protein